MITITLKELHDGLPFLRELSAQKFDLEISIPLSIALSVFDNQAKAIDKGLTDKAALMGFKLPDQPGQVPRLLNPKIDKQGNEDFFVTVETIEQFNADAEAYLKEQTTTLPIEKITKAQLEKSNAQLSPLQIVKLQFLFDFFSTEATDDAPKKRAKSK